MTARILVVDDVPANVKLLEAKLTAEYFEVITAENGRTAIELAGSAEPDVILLDVMMPEMDGFEACRQLKANANTAHIPVVMVTALDQPSDRVEGLRAGADDFLTKPVNDLALFARVRSLARLKLTLDELRMRQKTVSDMGIVADPKAFIDEGEISGKILLIEDRSQSVSRVQSTLGEANDLVVEADGEAALNLAMAGDFDLTIVSLNLQNQDGLRLVSQLRSFSQTRDGPVLVLVEEHQIEQLARGLDMGVNDYLIRPLDRNELVARVQTQMKRKRYSDRLRQNLELGLEMAITDQLTGLYNRRYMESHLKTQIHHALQNGKSVSFLIIDVDFFKTINDTHGHDVGDLVLKQFAQRLSVNVRGLDLACRYGGEEFVVVMPDTDVAFAYSIAERLRQEIADNPFDVVPGADPLSLTISIGVTSSEGKDDNADALLKRADQALYRAKNEGRNRVVAEAA